MTKDELIKLVSDELTVGGSLSISVNEDYISYLIDREIKQCYLEWRDLVYPVHGIIRKDEFTTSAFRSSRSIQFPECVYGIEECREVLTGGSQWFGLQAPDLGMNKIFYSEAYLSGFQALGSDWLNMVTASLSAYDQMRSFLHSEVQFRWNVSSHRMTIVGHEPTKDIWFTCLMGIPKDEVYDHPWFQKYIIGKAMISFHRSVKFFDGNLVVGGVMISTVMQDEGTKILEEVKEWVKGNDQPDWFLMFQ